MVATDTPGAPSHLLSELGFTVRADGGGLLGRAFVVPEMHVPGTERLRTSVLATWADMLTGLLAVQSVRPRVPVTLDLEIHLLRPAPGSGRIEGRSRVVKAGRAVFVATVDFSDEDGQLASGTGAFTVAPDVRLRMREISSLGEGRPERPTIQVPLAERAGCRRGEPGVATLVRSEDGLNSSRTVNGGLMALAAEEAILSLAPGATLSSLGLRYLRPVRVGPVRADARIRGALAHADLQDEGSDDRLAALATARLFDAGVDHIHADQRRDQCRPGV